jgi:hypothetical protein
VTTLVRQERFTGGELASELHAQHSLERYAIGLRRLLNFYPTPLGPLVNRPGLPLVSERAGKDHARKVVVRRFVFSEAPGQAYALELGHLYLRLHQDGGEVLNVGVPYEIVTPFVEDDLARLRFTQDGDVVTITHPAYGTRELRRYGHTNWTLTTKSFIPSLAAPGSLFGRGWDQVGDVSHPPKEWQWLVTAVSPDGEESLASFVIGPPTPTRKVALYSDKPQGLSWAAVDGAVEYRVYRGRNEVFGLVGSTTSTFFFDSILSGPGWWVTFDDDGIDPDFTIQPPSRVVPFEVTAWAPDTRYEAGQLVTNGGVYQCIESGLSASAGGPAGVGANISDGATAAWANATAYAIGARVVSAGNTYECTTAGVSKALPDGGPYLIGAFINDNGVMWEFKGRGHAARWRYIGPAPAAKRYPACCAFFEQRLALARSDAAPATIYLSETDNPARFDLPTLSTATSPIELTLRALTAQEIRSIVPARALIVLTSSAEWAVSGNGQGEPLTPTNPAAHVQSEHGSSWLPALKVGGDVIFAARSGRTVYALQDLDARVGYASEDVGFFSSHLFVGRTIVDWAYAAEPHRVVWAVLDDGTLLSFTYERRRNVWAWARHDVGGAGAVESVCTVPEGGEDALYAVVRRTIAGQTKRYVERMASRVVNDVRLGVFLDSAITYDGRNTGATTLTLTGATTWEADDELDVASSAPIFAGSNVGDVIVLDPDGTAPVRLDVIEYSDPSHVRVRAEAAVPASYQAAPTTSWALAVNTFSGLDHLEGCEVKVLADGVPQGPFTVVGGAIELEAPAAIVHAGLGYDQEVETLDLAGSAEFRSRVKAVARVLLELVSSAAALEVGETFDDLRPAQRRRVEHGYGPIPLETYTEEVRPSSTWQRAGRAAIRNSDPLPVSITGITREVDFGGR